MNSKDVNKTDLQKRMDEIVLIKNPEDLAEADEEYLHIRIINEIIEVMEKRGYSKAKLAAELGTSKSYITQLFSGDKIINLSMMSRIERLFNFRFIIKAEDFSQETKGRSKTVKNIKSAAIHKTKKDKQIKPAVISPKKALAL